MTYCDRWWPDTYDELMQQIKQEAENKADM